MYSSTINSFEFRVIIFWMNLKLPATKLNHKFAFFTKKSNIRYLGPIVYADKSSTIKLRKSTNFRQNLSVIYGRRTLGHPDICIINSTLVKQIKFWFSKSIHFHFQHIILFQLTVFIDIHFFIWNYLSFGFYVNVPSWKKYSPKMTVKSWLDITPKSKEQFH